MILAALATLGLYACGAPEPSGYHGALYFGQGPYLMRVSLADGSLSVVNHLGDRKIRELSPFGPGRLLVAETASVNSRNVPRISWMDLQTGQVSVLYSGVSARYLTDAGVIVYDDGSELYSVPQLGSGVTADILAHRSNEPVDMIALPGGALLIETGQPRARAIHVWTAASGGLRHLDALTAACRLDGAVWVVSLQRLACRARNDDGPGAGYVFAGLDGVVDRRLALPEKRQFRALAYIASQDVLILAERWRGFLGGQERTATWAYDIRSGDSVRLSKNQNLGDSVVYVGQ